MLEDWKTGDSIKWNSVSGSKKSSIVTEVKVVSAVNPCSGPLKNNEK